MWQRSMHRQTLLVTPNRKGGNMNFRQRACNNPKGDVYINTLLLYYLSKTTSNRECIGYYPSRRAYSQRILRYKKTNFLLEIEANRTKVPSGPELAMHRDEYDPKQKASVHCLIKMGIPFKTHPANFKSSQCLRPAVLCLTAEPVIRTRYSTTSSFRPHEGLACHKPRPERIEESLPSSCFAFPLAALHVHPDSRGDDVRRWLGVVGVGRYLKT